MNSNKKCRTEVNIERSDEYRIEVKKNSFLNLYFVGTICRENNYRKKNNCIFTLNRFRNIIRILYAGSRISFLSLRKYFCYPKMKRVN